MSDVVIQELCFWVAGRPTPQNIIEVLHNGGPMSRIGMEDMDVLAVPLPSSTWIVVPSAP